MTRREALCGALGNLVTGYVFLHLNFNLGSINILPNWFGYLCFRRAQAALAEEEQAVRLLEPLNWLLFSYELVAWLLACFWYTLDVPVFTALVGAVGLYYHFQLLTNVADIVAWYGYPDSGALLRQRNVRTVVATIMSFSSLWQNWENGTFVMAAFYWIMLIVFLMTVIFVCSELTHAKKYLAEAPEEVFATPPKSANSKQES